MWAHVAERREVQVSELPAPGHAAGVGTGARDLESGSGPAIYRKALLGGGVLHSLFPRPVHLPV